MELRITKDVIKIGTLGESRVGKTNLSNVFVGNKFDEEEFSTIGIGSLLKKMEITYKGKSKKVSIKILNTVR